MTEEESIVQDIKQLENHLFNVTDDTQFQSIARKIFTFQYKLNPVYNRYCEFLGKTPYNCRDLKDIPFLPIDFYKKHKVLTDGTDYEMLFESSGTTGMERSKHFLKRVDLYKKSFRKGYELFYGKPEDYCVLALLPGYLENKHSSLIHMAKGLMADSKCSESGFYLNDLDKLAEKLIYLNKKRKKVLLLGVSFALLDMAEKFPMELKNTIVMETGGMKGRRKEITREELHEALKKGFGVNEIHSEYGMAELLSQAYSKHDGIFQTPPWMKIFIRDAYDPYEVHKESEDNSVNGGINIVDLANLYSCSFIETKDIGKLYPNGTFEVVGRLDYSDIRGCNLMVI